MLHILNPTYCKRLKQARRGLTGIRKLKPFYAYHSRIAISFSYFKKHLLCSAKRVYYPRIKMVTTTFKDNAASLCIREGRFIDSFGNQCVKNIGQCQNTCG